MLEDSQDNGIIRIDANVYANTWCKMPIVLCCCIRFRHRSPRRRCNDVAVLSLFCVVRSAFDDNYNCYAISLMITVKSINLKCLHESTPIHTHIEYAPWIDGNLNLFHLFFSPFGYLLIQFNSREKSSLNWQPMAFHIHNGNNMRNMIQGQLQLLKLNLLRKFILCGH